MILVMTMAIGIKDIVVIVVVVTSVRIADAVTLAMVVGVVVGREIVIAVSSDVTALNARRI